MEIFILLATIFAVLVVCFIVTQRVQESSQLKINKLENSHFRLRQEIEALQQKYDAVCRHVEILDRQIMEREEELRASKDTRGSQDDIMA